MRDSDVFELINPILPYIPDQLAGEDDLRLVFSVHDGPMAQSDWSLMDISRELAEAGLGKSQQSSTGGYSSWMQSGMRQLLQQRKNNNDTPTDGKCAYMTKNPEC